MYFEQTASAARPLITVVSANPVLTATHHSNESPRLSDFFPLGSGGQTPQRRVFTQNGSNDVFSRKDVPFAVKVATFHTP